MNKYVIALAIGGVMEHPHFEYQDYRLIEASSKEEAIRKYKEETGCEYWTPTCMADMSPRGLFGSKSLKVHNSEVPVKWLESLEGKLPDFLTKAENDSMGVVKSSGYRRDRPRPFLDACVGDEKEVGGVKTTAPHKVNKSVYVNSLKRELIGILVRVGRVKPKSLNSLMDADTWKLTMLAEASPDFQLSPDKQKHPYQWVRARKIIDSLSAL